MAKLTFLGSYVFTKCIVGPPQPHRPHRDDEGQPPGGNLVGSLVLCGVWATMVMGCVAYFARVQYKLWVVMSLEMETTLQLVGMSLMCTALLKLLLAARLSP
jgi:hypothetical protein